MSVGLNAVASRNAARDQKRLLEIIRAHYHAAKCHYLWLRNLRSQSLSTVFKSGNTFNRSALATAVYRLKSGQGAKLSK